MDGQTHNINAVGSGASELELPCCIVGLGRARDTFELCIDRRTERFPRFAPHDHCEEKNSFQKKSSGRDSREKDAGNEGFNFRDRG